MALLLDFLIITAAAAALWWGANLIVSGASSLAHRLGIPDLVIGLTVVAFGTSAPEFGVTIIAALEGHGDISVSNVAGSNVINLGFVLGFVALIRAIKTSKIVVRRDGVMLIFATLILGVFLYDTKLVHWEGIIFVALLIIYNAFLIKSNSFKPEDIDTSDFKLIDPIKLILGIGLVTGASHFLVESSIDIARVFGLSEWTIGQTIVAFGTSIPELATSLAAAIKGKHGMSVGNLIGSNIFNILGVLGFSAIIRTMTVDHSATYNLYIMMAFTVMVVMMMHTDRKISRLEGGLIAFINLLIWVMSFVGIIK